MKKIVTLLVIAVLCTPIFAANKSTQGAWRPEFAPTSTSIPSVLSYNHYKEEKEKAAKDEAKSSEEIQGTNNSLDTTVELATTSENTKNSDTENATNAEDVAIVASDTPKDEELKFAPPPELTDELIARAYLFDTTDYKGKLKKSVRLVNMTKNSEGKDFYFYYYFGPTKEDWEYYGVASLAKYYTTPRVESPYNKKLFEIRYFALIPKDEGAYRYEIKKQKGDLLIFVYDEDEIVLTDDEKHSATIIDSATIDGKFKSRIAFKNEQEIQPLSFWVYGFNETQNTKSEEAVTDENKATLNANSDTATVEKSDETTNSDWQIIGAAQLFENGTTDIVETPLKKKATNFAYYALIERDGKTGYVLQASKAYGDLVIKARDPVIVAAEEAAMSAATPDQNVEAATDNGATSDTNDVTIKD